MNTEAIDKFIKKGVIASHDLTGIITIIYGDKKVGKSTFAARFPNPLFLDCEDGLRTVSNDDGKVPDHITIDSWSGLMEVTEWLESTDHGYNTLVIDGLNEAWSYLEKATLEKFKVEHTNDGALAYGKGNKMMAREFRYWFQRLRKVPVTVVLCAHSRTVEFENNNMKLNKRVPFVDDTVNGNAWLNIMPAINMVLYASKEQTKEGIVHRLRCQGNQMIEAGNPFNLPEIINFDYDQLVKAVEACSKYSAAAE